ncbi:acetamidase regulatory protein [Moniliophthora roreri]|nr:acetamidase regulatory protein [Moniliophthora roreri]
MAESPLDSSSNSPSDQPSELPSQPPPTPLSSDRPPKKARQRKQADPKPASPDPPQPPIVHQAPVLQPYPGHPHPYYMNPPYPGHPYQPSPHPNYPPPNHGQSSHSSPIPTHPHPPPYAYPVPASPHPGYYHPTYQYPPPVMMYPPPPHHHHHPPPPHAEHSPSASSPAPPELSTGAKRKRKGTKDDKGSEDEGRASATPIVPTSGTSTNPPLDLKKRTKTQRACDSCRTRKIRCDILPEMDPPICQHCKQYNFECSFFLPITETRFKKKKLEAENAEREKEASRPAAPSLPESVKRDVGVFGYDARYNHSFQVSKSGDGLIQVQKPNKEEQPASMVKPINLNVDQDVLQQLVNAYFSDVAPLLPVITKTEFLAHSTPPPILFYSMCLVAAARREVPQQVFDSIRHNVDTIIKSDDVLSNASIVNVQSLLILCMTGDCHSQFVPSALSALWVRLGAAIRMAQDLGLHRCESLKQPDMDLRRRLWGLCLISDRWISFTYGHPYMISLEDCDARLPSSGDITDDYIDELVRLSILLGRVQKALYTPSGLKQTRDETLEAILRDLQNWRDKLPEELKFRGPTTSRLGGLLNLLYVCVLKMFFRLFMRISYTLPSHITFGLTVERWSNLVIDGNQAIDWLDANERVYDVWLVVAYAAVSCGLIQVGILTFSVWTVNSFYSKYHTYVRRKSPEAETQLRKLRDCVARWEKAISPDHMSARRKTAEIITLLYEALHTPLSLEKPVLNPSGGVVNKQPMDLDYRPDPNRPGGGVFIARGKVDGLKDLPEGTVIPEDEEAEGETLSSTLASASTSKDDHDRNLNLSSLSSTFAPPLSVATQLGESSSGSMVNFTPLGGRERNLNPAMNRASGPDNQVINLSDQPQPTLNSLQEFAMTDNGYFEGMPNGMFEFEQWEHFFSTKLPQSGQPQQ